MGEEVKRHFKCIGVAWQILAITLVHGTCYSLQKRLKIGRDEVVCASNCL